MIQYQYRGQGVPHVAALAKQYEPQFMNRLLHNMLYIRLVEEAVADHYHEDQMKTPIHLAIGQEAVAVGCAAALRKQDQVFCGHRTHAHYLAKGGDLNAMFAEFHCRINGCCASRGGSMHLLDKSVGMEGSSAIVAGIVPIATGAALAAKLQKNDKRIFVFVGDAAMEEGAVWESMNFAVLKKLPIVYVCENNYYSVCTPLAYRQAQGVELCQKAQGFGLHSVSIDGNNIFEVHEAAKAAIANIHAGHGPAFIEAHTYRWRGHHGAFEVGDAGYRSSNEVKHWENYDPITMLREALIQHGYFDEKSFLMSESTILDKIEKAFAHSLASPEPTCDDLMKHVYSN